MSDRCGMGIRYACILLLCTALPIMVQATEIQGHRGARGLLPENTLPAFERAIALGVDQLELDIGMTRDGVPVVHHDRALNPDIARDADGNWLSGPELLLWRLQYRALSAFDVGRTRPGSRTANRFPEQEPRDGTRIPTLREVLALGRGPGAEALRFNIETKISPMEPDATPDPSRFVQATVEVLESEGMAGRVTIQSFDWRTIREVQAQAPEIRTVCLTVERSWFDNIRRGRSGPSPWTAGLDIDAVGGSIPRLVEQAGCAVWSPYFRDLTAETLAEAHSLGLEVVVWTVNDVDDMAALAKLGVDGLITDYPDRAIRLLRPSQ